MNRKEKTERTDALICRKEILALQGKIRRLESEKNAALARLRQLETNFRTFEKIEVPAENLRQSGERFQDMVERINDWVWEVDPNGVYTYASPRIRDFLGFDPEELIGKTPFDLMSETEAKRVGRIFRECVEKRQPFCAIENTNRHKNGQSIVLETNGVPFFDEEGNLLGYRGVDRNITERKEMERERELLLEENRRRLSLVEAIFEATQDGIVVYGPEGEILRMNAAAEDSLGFLPEERAMNIAQRWELLRVTKMDGKPMSLEEIPSQKALAGEKEQAILHFQPPRRQARWFSVSAAPIRLPEAHPASAVAIFTDISKFHDLQQEHELFMQMISHDLRTPVTVIQGHVEMLEQRLTKKDEITYLNLEAIQASNRQLDSMMDDLMRFFQDKKGEIPLELERIDISQFFNKLVRRLDIPGIKERLQNDVPPGLPAVLADEESLERILSNLLSNALKYSPPNTPVIITAQRIDLEICISVTDRGKGISRADQPFIFDKFFRARDAGKKTGIGLGLFITRKLVEAHGGRIWVKSEPGAGNVFTFSLPVVGPERK